MLRGRRERGSSNALPSTSLLIPPNPAIADPGSSTTARGGILLNPLCKDGSTSVSPPPPHGRHGSSLRSPSASSSYSASGGRRSTSVSSSTSINSSSGGSFTSGRSSNEGHDGGVDAADSITTAASSSASPRLKFAPLPESGRLKRSNSIALGVAARAQLLQGNGMGGGGGAGAGGGGDRPGVSKPHWQQQVYNPNATPMWYNGGPMPENVKTFKDLKPGIKKAWGALTRRRSSSNASSASTTSSTSGTSASTGGGGGGSEGDISSINEEDENEIETPPSTAGTEGQGQGQGQGHGVGPAGVTLGKEGLLVNQPPGSELSNQNINQTPFEGGQPLRRKDSDAYSDLSSSALSETETDLDTRGAALSSQGMSESPSYTPGAGPQGHYFPHHLQHHNANHAHDENYEGVRSGEVTPKRSHSPISASPNGERAYHNKHWTPHVSDHHPPYQYTNAGGGSGTGSGSTPGSGANTPRRRMSMGDMSTSFGGTTQGGDHHHSKRGPSVFGFDEAQLKNRLGQMDLNSRRRKPLHHDEHENGDENNEALEKGVADQEEEEVPVPLDSPHIKAAGMEVAV